MSRKAKVYSFNGEELTAKEISIRHNIPVLLVSRSFSDSNFPSLQEILDWRKANGINDITCFKYSGASYRRGSRKPILKYEYEGESMTAWELSEKYGIPERLIWKAYNDPSKPSLSEMIAWRKERGIFDKNDYRCVSVGSGIKKPVTCVKKANCKKYVSLKTKYRPPEDQHTGLHIGCVYGSCEVIDVKKSKDYRRFSLRCIHCGKHFQDITLQTLLRVQNLCNCKTQEPEVQSLPSTSRMNQLIGLHVGSVYGSYEIIGETTYRLYKRLHLHCLHCGKYFQDITIKTLLRSVPDSQCHCQDLSHCQIIKHLPASLQENALIHNAKGMSYYQSFVGFTVCGVKITGVTKKEGNDCDIYFFSCICPKCKTQFTVKAFNIITDTFRHTCEEKRKAKKNLLKNSSCFRKQPAIYKNNSCHVHKEVDPDMIELLKSTVGFYSLEYGTEGFMNLCLDAEFLGKRQLLESIYAIS